MKKSLKTKLFDLIKEKGYVSYGEVCQYVSEEGYKVSTAERRLRGLMATVGENGEQKDPLIFKDLKTSRRNTPYIAGYMYKGTVTRKVVYREVIKSDGEVVMQAMYE